MRNATKELGPKVGDRVCRGDRGGIVVKRTSTTAQVRWDDHPDIIEKFQLGKLKPETASDVAARKHRMAMEQWESDQPRAKYTQHLRSVGVASVPLNLRSGAEMRAAAAELMAMAAWWDRKPKEAL